MGDFHKRKLRLGEGVTSMKGSCKHSAIAFGIQYFGKCPIM